MKAETETLIQRQTEQLETQIRREVEASAFRFVTSDESLPDQRIVVFARAES